MTALAGVAARCARRRTCATTAYVSSRSRASAARRRRARLLLAARAVQGVSGAVVLAAAGARWPRGPGHTWLLFGVLSAAVGPVVGGALTQAFSWRAIFIAQAPVPLLAAAFPQTWRSTRRRRTSRRSRRSGQLLALGLVSGALTALLFGVVLLIVVGWAMQPLSAAFAVI